MDEIISNMYSYAKRTRNAKVWTDATPLRLHECFFGLGGVFAVCKHAGIPVKLGNASVEADGAKFARYYEHLNAEHGNVHVHTRDIMTLDVDDVDDADGADAFSLLHMVTDGYNDIGYKTHVHISHDATSLTTSPIPIDPSTLKPMTVITITTCAAVFIELFADQ